MGTMGIVLLNLLYSLVGGGAAIAFMFFGYRVIDHVTPFDTAEQLKAGNVAVGDHGGWHVRRHRHRRRPGGRHGTQLSRAPRGNPRAALLAAALALGAVLGCAPAERSRQAAEAAPEPAAATDTALPTAGALPGTLPVEHGQWTTHYDHHFRKYSKRFFGPGFDWRWFKAQGIAESSLQEDAESWVGAKGIMQIMPATLQEIAEKSSLPVLDSSDPGLNIAAGVFYDRNLYDRWHDIPHTQERLAFTFASYNGGRSRILRAQEACPDDCARWARVTHHAPEETRGYVARIMSLMGHEPP